MLCFRLFLVILLMIFTACATCSILFPQFRYVSQTLLTGDVTNTVYFWYNETKSGVSGSTATSTVRQYTRDMTCTQQYTYYTVQAALSVAGAGLGGIATLFMSCWTSAGRSRCLGVMSLLATFLAFACCTVTVALSAYSYTNAICNASSAPKDKYSLVEGFGLICAAAGGFLITMLLELIECCCCSGTSSYDDDDKDY